jgi:hypothetical protein
LDQLSNYWTTICKWWIEGLHLVSRDEYTPILDTTGFLGIIAFSIALFTLSGPKFQFRQATALLPLRQLFFAILFGSALATFLTEAFVLYGVKFPAFIDPNTVNFLIAVLIAFLVLYWMLISFIRSPRFSRYTAPNFFHQTFIFITNGSREELLGLAHELMGAIPRLVANSPSQRSSHLPDEEQSKVTKVESYAHDLMYLLSDPRFCDVIAEEVPTFAAYLVEEMVRQKKYDAPGQQRWPPKSGQDVKLVLTKRRTWTYGESDTQALHG